MKPNSRFKIANVSTAKVTPTSYKDEVDQLIRDMLKLGVIEKVDTATSICAPGKFVAKPGGRGVCLVTDFTSLNLHIERPVTQFPSIQSIKKSI